jgi:transposase
MTASALRDLWGRRRVGGTGRRSQRLGLLRRENAPRHEQAGRRQRVDQQLRSLVHELTAQGEELRRAAKRQAAPLSRNTPAPTPKRPDRKPGAAYGQHARRPVPRRVARVVAVELPAARPHRGDRLGVERVACRYREDLPPPRTSAITRCAVQIGRCVGCRRRIRPRHPEQTSEMAA